ncbi:MAG TPA: hypothetical protein VMB47_15225 [Candidatus Aquilonibacter sp.]|nr:hypothetical protein [Candidatus Aquilonibacter sp.]
MHIAQRSQMKVADEVWLAVALLHREHPKREDFSVAEIVERARQESASRDLRPGVYVHVVQHCVAGRAPNPGRYRMLVETRKNHRRLFKMGDPFHPDRGGSKTVPDREELPEKYRGLLDWYRNNYARNRSLKPEADPLLALRGSGKKLWADEHADEYVRHMREGWE